MLADTIGGFYSILFCFIFMVVYMELASVTYWFVVERKEEHSFAVKKMGLVGWFRAF